MVFVANCCLLLAVILLGQPPAEGQRSNRPSSSDSGRLPAIDALLILPSEVDQFGGGGRLPEDTCVRSRPSDRHKRSCLATLERVAPVVQLAKTRLRLDRCFPGFRGFNVHLAAADCRNQRTTTLQFLRANEQTRLSVVFGPLCDYGVAALMRISDYYRLPVLTPGAFSHSFGDKREFNGLIRIGQGQFETLRDFAVSLLDRFNWRRCAYVYQVNFFETEMLSQEFCKLFGNTVYERLRSDVDVKQLGSQDLGSLRSWLKAEIGNRLSVILLCASPDAVRDIMLAADNLGMVETGEYVFFNIDVSGGSQPDEPWVKIGDDDASNERAKRAYRALKTVTLRKSRSPEYQEFEQLVRNQVDDSYMNTTGRRYEMNNFVGAFYDAVMLYAIAVNETIANGGSPTNGFSVTHRMKNKSFEGITGRVTMNGDGDRYSDYSLLDWNPDSQKFDEVVYYSGAQNRLIQGNRSWFWINGKPPADTPVCGYDRSKCPKKEIPPWAWLLIALLIVTFCFAVISYFIYRHYKLEAELAAMTWRIRWDELDKQARKPVVEFSQPNGAPSVYNWMEEGNRASYKQHGPFTRTESRLSITSCETMAANDPEKHQIFTDTAIFKGTRVARKMLNICKPKIELTRPMLLELKKMQTLQHDHITRFVGACIDPNHYCIITEYCPKGSLQDILENEKIKLDKMMIYSLMHDMVKGMDFIHSSDIRAHGNLKSSNCVVDSRFVLKITDFGLHHLRALEEPADDEDGEYAYWKRKLWTAPELLRIQKPPVGGTQKGDVYSFAIILHEMAFRQSVFYIENDSVPPNEIVERVKLRQQPPFRPSIIDDNHADETMVGLMTRCWAENPSDRPDFPHIRKQVRSLNREYETSNIVDNLLKRMEQYASNLEALVEERTAGYFEQKQKAENLLHQLLPKSVAEQLIRGQPVSPEAFDMVTIYFSDIVGFTSLCSQSTPMQVVNLLNDLYTCFDSILENFDVYKVETIGDAYMVVSGLPRRNENQHAYEIASMSLELLHAVRSFRIRHRPDEQLMLRIGIHSGPVCAGVVGLKMPRYCLFGDTVNTASRMESNGLPLKIHVSDATKRLLDVFDHFLLELRGEVEMKGKGMQLTYWLSGRRSSQLASKTFDGDDLDSLVEPPPPPYASLSIGNSDIAAV